MRIVFLATTFHPVIGGAESYALNVTRGLGALGHKVTVITDMIASEPPAAVIAENLTIRRLENYRAGFAAPDRIFWEQMQFGLYDELSRHIAESAPDIIVSNSLDLCVVAKVAALHARRPWVATFHEQAPERDPFGEAKLRLAYNILGPDAVIAGSQFYLARARRFASPDVCHLIYHGIDTDQFQNLESAAEVRRHYRVPAGNWLLVTAGRLKARKGFADALHAMRRLKQEGISATLVVAGSLNSASLLYRDELRSLVCTLGLSDDVVFDEQLTHDRMPWLLSGSDLVVQASHEEGLGLAVIEAMACCRPVVTTRISGITEIVTSESVAALVEPGSPRHLAETIGALLGDNAHRRSLGAAGRAHIIENFSIDRMVKSTADLLAQVVARGP